MEIGKVYGFMYQGIADHEPQWRQVLVEESDNSSVLGKLMEEHDFEGIRRFRFDRMKSKAVEVK
jgi:hypothetical protein